MSFIPKPTLSPDDYARLAFAAALALYELDINPAGIEVDPDLHDNGTSYTLNYRDDHHSATGRYIGSASAGTVFLAKAKTPCGEHDYKNARECFSGLNADNTPKWVDPRKLKQV